MYHAQYNSADKKMKSTSMEPSHKATIRGLGHHSIRGMPMNIYQAQAHHHSQSYDESFKKRSIRENLSIRNAVHASPHYNLYERIPQNITSADLLHPCPKGMKGHTGAGGVGMAKHPACDYGSQRGVQFHTDGHRQNLAHVEAGRHQSHNMKRVQGSRRMRERMGHIGEKDEFYKMGRM